MPGFFSTPALSITSSGTGSTAVSVETQITKGYVAVAIPTSASVPASVTTLQQQSFSGPLVSAAFYILPGDHIDMLVQSTNGTQGVRYTFQDVIVLRVGTSGSTSTGAADVLLVEVPRAEAPLLSALVVGDGHEFVIKYVLRPESEWGKLTVTRLHAELRARRPINHPIGEADHRDPEHAGQSLRRLRVMTPAAVVAAALAASAVLSIFAFLLSRGQSQAGEMARRLNQYGGDTVAVTAPPRVKTGNALRDLLDALTSGLNPLLSRTSHTGKLADDLQKADLKLKSSEWLLAVVGLGILVGLLVALRYGSPLAFVPCPIVVYFLSGFFLKFRQKRRTRAFNNQLGDTLMLLSNALKAGHSFAQALASVAKNANPPISEEFARATREIALGINVDEALNHMVTRNKSEDFDLMVTAVQIQRVVGGNLAEILDTIAFTIRERVRIQGEIRTLTAQARASGWIITILPIALAGFLALISPTYFDPMITDPLGHIMLGMAIFSIAVGAVAIQKIVKIEV